jgi:hypothetical protein
MGKPRLGKGMIGKEWGNEHNVAMHGTDNISYHEVEAYQAASRAEPQTEAYSAA